ncbi:MAG: hypothetical protein JOZ78_05060 [Chroococcidiopsidaceae cyanobacterium CP_BM_ER_R8_30]|nr:hypothetical protein [Chroococcidiopsidaceae cyanobacterium CP_BM_ER_R8_30]
MKELPDEKTMLAALEEARLMEKAAREMCEMVFSVAHSAQKRVLEFRNARSAKETESYLSEDVTGKV